MRDNNSLNIKVGLFVFITVLIFFVGIFLVTGDKKFFEKHYYVRTHFDNTVGLLPGAYVRLSGVKVGNVDKIGFPDKMGENSIEVTIKVSREGAERITPDSKATIRTEGLLGAKYIEIIRGELPPFARIDQMMVIKSYTPPELQQLIGSSDELLTNLISISKNLDETSAMFADKKTLNSISQTLNSIRKSADELRKSLRAIEEGEGALSKLIYDEEFGQKLTVTLNNLGEMSDNFKDISESLKEGEGTLGALLVDPSIHDGLKGVLGKAQRSKFIRSAVQYLVENRSQSFIKE